MSAVAALRRWRQPNDNVSGATVFVMCPACDEPHGFVVEHNGGGPVWAWNGDLDTPTFTPSLKVTGVQWSPEHGFHKPRHHVAVGGTTVCHSHVTAGQWQFHGDSTHDLAGQTVPLPPLPDHLRQPQT